MKSFKAPALNTYMSFCTHLGRNLLNIDWSEKYFEQKFQRRINHKFCLQFKFYVILHTRDH